MPPDPGKILDLASAFYRSGVLFAASDLEIFTTLSEVGSASSAELARDLRLDARACRLLLDGCVAIGLIEKNGDRYSNTPEASCFLVHGSPHDLSGAIRYNRDVFPAWQCVTRLVRSGHPVERPELHLGDDPARTRRFVLAMHGKALGIGRAVVPQLRLAGRKRLLDVGGGPGTYSVLIAESNPALECVVLDLPAVTAIALELIEDQGLSDRVRVLAGDYHVTPFPPGIDAVNFFGMLHQESPDAIALLLQKAFDVLPSGGVVHIMDVMTDQTRTAPPFSALFGLNMALTSANGWVFSEDDLREWLTEAGFVDCEIIRLPPPTPHWLGIATKP